MSIKLYEIKAGLEELLDTATVEAEENEGVISDELSLEIDELYEDFNEKVLDIARYIKSVSAEAEAIKKEKLVLASRQQMCENTAKRLKKYLSGQIDVNTKIKDSTAMVSFRSSSSVNIIDGSKMPESCFKVVKTPILTEIKGLIKLGGLDGIAEMKKNYNIQIK